MTNESQRNKEAVESLHDAINTDDLQVICRSIDELVDDGALLPTSVPVAASAPQALKQVFAGLLRAFPDLQITNKDLIVEGDKVVARNTVTGTHLGEHIGHSATGRRVSYSEIFIFRIAHGRVADVFGVVDVLSQLRQIGALPESFGVPTVEAPATAA